MAGGLKKTLFSHSAAEAVDLNIRVCFEYVAPSRALDG